MSARDRSEHDPQPAAVEGVRAGVRVVADDAPPAEPELFRPHAEFERDRDPMGRMRYEHPTDCEGMLRIVDRSGPLWEIDCDGCDFETGINLMRSDPERMIAYRLERSGIPEPFVGRAFDKSEPAQKETLAKCRAWLQEFRSAPSPAVALWGAPGRGKTHLLCLIAETLIRSFGTDAIYRSATGMLDDLRNAVDAPRRFELVWERLLSAEVLVLDDLGAGKMTEWAQDRLATLVDHRYAKGLPLVVATNIPPQRWEDVFGERTASRLKGMCVALRLEGSDRRAQGVQGSFAEAAA